MVSDSSDSKWVWCPQIPPKRVWCPQIPPEHGQAHGVDDFWELSVFVSSAMVARGGFGQEFPQA
ncbi:MAG: hypothetical protein HW380_2929 [Magnetococcales bacterium]|nr:hypothetical protein [Magnetococcales bacterium]